jgi:hypothetical protein
MHDVRAKFLEDTMQAVIRAPAKSGSFAKKPGLQPVFIELLLQI